ncbi:hypothetical protein LY90DRAFT_707351 [Neocallimastix californiae]|uniref:Calponin-homology (CH) domain-containing protein n=1 Tax=Neocallimastix californiae TaxID=1754190 RepID=A0A1Y2AGL6_9FUNG|nr:hypothetical protein LY90DRAFT_707351 [Neocallimastix californiae]|eukprot:ORY21701.1 hypothetical protein LY90DRAFT_707351 [Neocallimastix californiae]
MSNSESLNDLLYKECLELSNIISREIKDIINQVRNPNLYQINKNIRKIENVDSIRNDKDKNHKNSLATKEYKIFKKEQNISSDDVNKVIKKYNDSNQNNTDYDTKITNKRYGIYNADNKSKLDYTSSPCVNPILPYPTTDSNANNNNSKNSSISSDDGAINESNTEYHYIEDVDIAEKEIKNEPITDSDSLPPKLPDDYSSSLSSASTMSLTFSVSSSGSSYSSKYNNHRKRINKYSSSKKILSSPNSPETSFIIRTNSDYLLKNTENNMLGSINENEIKKEFSKSQSNNNLKKNFITISPIEKIDKNFKSRDINDQIINHAIEKLENSFHEINSNSNTENHRNNFINSSMVSKSINQRSLDSLESSNKHEIGTEKERNNMKENRIEYKTEKEIINKCITENTNKIEDKNVNENEYKDRTIENLLEYHKNKTVIKNRIKNNDYGSNDENKNKNKNKEKKKIKNKTEAKNEDKNENENMNKNKSANKDKNKKEFLSSDSDNQNGNLKLIKNKYNGDFTSKIINNNDDNNQKDANIADKIIVYGKQKLYKDYNNNINLIERENYINEGKNKCSSDNEKEINLKIDNKSDNNDNIKSKDMISTKIFDMDEKIPVEEIKLSENNKDNNYDQRSINSNSTNSSYSTYEIDDIKEIKDNNENNSKTRDPTNIPISYESKIPTTPLLRAIPSPSLIPKLSNSPSLYGNSSKTSISNFSLHSRRPSSSLSIHSNINSPSLLPVYVSTQKLNHKVSNSSDRTYNSSLSIDSSPKITANKKLHCVSVDSIPSPKIHPPSNNSKLCRLSVSSIPSPKITPSLSNSKLHRLSVDSIPSPKSTPSSNNSKLHRLSVESIPSPKTTTSSNKNKLHRMSVDSILTMSRYSPAKMVAKYPPPAPSSYVSCRHTRYQSMNENDLNSFNQNALFENNEKGNGCDSPQISNQKFSFSNSMIPLSPRILSKRHSRTLSNSSNSSIASLPLPPSSLPIEPPKKSNIIINHNRKNSTSSIPIPSPKLTCVSSNASSPSQFCSNNSVSSSPKLSYSLSKTRFYNNKNYSITDISDSNSRIKSYSFTNNTNNYKTNSVTYEDQFNASTLLQYKDEISKKNYHHAPSISSISSFGSKKNLDVDELLKKYEKKKIREKEKHYLEWIKECLEEYGEDDIYIDVENDHLSNILSDGIILAYLVEYLSNRSVGNIYLHPKIRQDKYYNLKKVFYLIKDELFVPAKATEYDIECGDLSAIFSLLGQLKDHYHRMDLKEPV